MHTSQTHIHTHTETHTAALISPHFNLGPVTTMRLLTSDSKLFLFSGKKKKNKTSCLLVWKERMAAKTKGGGVRGGRGVGVHSCVCIRPWMCVFLWLFQLVYSPRRQRWDRELQCASATLCTWFFNIMHLCVLSTCMYIHTCACTWMFQGDVSSYLAGAWEYSTPECVWVKAQECLTSLQPLERVELNKPIVL